MDSHKKNTKKRKNSLERLLLNLSFLLSILIISIIGVGSYYQASKFAAANQLVIHTHQVIQATNRSFLSMLEAESLSKDYLITGNNRFIDHINEKMNSLQYYLSLAKQLILDNKQQEKLIHLEHLFNDRAKLIQESILLKKNNRIQAPKGTELVHQAENLSAKIKTALLQINEKEFQFLKTRGDDALHSFHQLNLFIISASAITLFTIFIGMLVLNRQLSQQRQAENKFHQSETLLKEIIDGSNDFIAALNLKYEFIAFNASFQNEFKRIFGETVKLGMNLKNMLTHLPLEQKKALDIWGKALSGEEFTVITEFGNANMQLPYEITFSSIYDDQGNLIGSAHIARNVEARIEAEKNIKLANEELKSAYHELKEHDKGVSLLNEMDALLQACLTIDEALKLVSIYAKKLLPRAAGIIYLVDPSSNYLISKTAWNTPQNEEKIFSADACWALRQKKTYRFLNKHDNMHCKHYEPKDSIELFFCVPLLAQKELIGLLYIEIKGIYKNGEEKVTHSIDSYELIINNLAAMISLSMANIKLKETLRIRSIRDPLTKLYNRAYLNESLEREINRAERNHIPLAIIMLDIDYFKNINDTLGHRAGDLILEATGKLLLREVRKSDIACRYGGEEFLLMLYNTSLEDTIQRTEHIRKAIARMKFQFSPEIVHSVTASFGIAMYPEHTDQMNKLIEAADKALYISKKTGRNKVSVYSAPLDQ